MSLAFLGWVCQYGASTSNSENIEALLTPEEAWNIDTKMDDGKPGTGKVIARLYDTCTDATTHNDYDAPYDLDDNSAGCVIMFKEAF